MMERLLKKIRKEQHMHGTDIVLAKLINGDCRCIKCDYNSRVATRQEEAKPTGTRPDKATRTPELYSRAGSNTDQKMAIQPPGVGIQPSTLCCASLDAGDAALSRCSPVISNLTASERIILNRLELCDPIPGVLQKPLTELPPPRNASLSLFEDYLCFLNSISSYTASRCVKSFDTAVFFRILMRDTASQAVRDFTAALLKDPMQYSKDEKGKVLLLLIFAYIACKDNGLDVRPYRRKIEEHEYLFKPLHDFDLQWKNDPFIDKFIVHLRRATNDLEEALFLNRIYMSKPARRDVFSAFHKRLCNALEALSESYIFSFLQHVFTYSTVVFSCITEMQLYKLAISYYLNENKKEQLADMLAILIMNIDNCEHHAMLVEHLRALKLSSPKYKRQQMLFEIQQFRFISEYKGFFMANRDSYTAISLGFMELASLYRKIGLLGKEYEVLEVLFYLFENIKIEFFTQLVGQYNLLLTEVIEALDVASPSFLQFNRLHWGMLSTIILTTQKLGIARYDEKKKKSRAVIRLSEVARSAHRLVDTINRIEKRALQMGLVGIAILKKRGFKIGQLTVRRSSFGIS